MRITGRRRTTLHDWKKREPGKNLACPQMEPGMNVYRSSTNGCEVQSSEAESPHDEGHNCSHPINKTFRADVIRSPDPSRGTRFSSRLVARLDRKRLGRDTFTTNWNSIRGVFDKQTRRKPLVFAADA